MKTMMELVEDYAIAYHQATGEMTTNFERTDALATTAREAVLARIQQYNNCFEEVELWSVRGIDGARFDEKINAERAARLAFPEEDPDTRYGRIFFTKFWKEST